MTTKDKLKNLADAGTNETEIVQGVNVIDAMKNEDLMAEFVGVSAIARMLERRKDLLSGIFRSKLWKEVLSNWLANGVKPANPKLVTKKGSKVDCSAILQVQSRFKAPEFKNEAEALQMLANFGMDEETAVAFLDENVVFEDKLKIKDLSELAEGHWVNENKKSVFIEATETEQSAAAKFLAWASGEEAEMWNDEERKVALFTTTKIIVKKDFLNNAAKYCSSVEKLGELLNIIKPVDFFSHTKYADNDSFEEKSIRMRDLFESLLTSDVVMDEETEEEREAA